MSQLLLTTIYLLRAYLCSAENLMTVLGELLRINQPAVSFFFLKRRGEGQGFNIIRCYTLVPVFAHTLCPE